ncbi:MAG: hypothetical protein IM598_07515 [Chitinophagaceae bacterium]|nr:hypothetical protein [Chitinophagaceae bacterium]MCA6459288.1 hypothetical protein [Chitinophagaceae bacterium]MCA6464658.1 hypothetical protein [Chitinophagaceae bacterium]
MENEIIETVLTEVLEEQKQSNQLAQKNVQFLEEQVLILKRMEEKSARQNEELKTFLLQKMEAFSAQVESHAKPVRREFRILLFPEHGTTEYYKVVFGRILFWLVMLCIAKFAYLLGDKWITQEYENNKYQKAWETLYEQQSKANQKMMQKYLTE